MEQQQQIEGLRSMVTTAIETINPDEYDEVDIERFRTDDNWVHRFLLHHKYDETEACKMVLDTLKWRSQFNANSIRKIVNEECLRQGLFFFHGKDKDGVPILVFKAKKYVKNATALQNGQQCLLYWLEKVERETDGRSQVTVFFDMSTCGVSNLDLEFIKFLINLFKLYYPYFLNYILIFEMTWTLSAVFKVIKSWLPEEALEKIKQIGKTDIARYVQNDDILTCWGGSNDYEFTFKPETLPVNQNGDETDDCVAPSRKVHFAEGSPTSEQQTAVTTLGSLDSAKDVTPPADSHGPLVITPSNTIVFNRDGKEQSTTLELWNTDDKLIISFKLKTTSPEKFRVRPSVGLLSPGQRAQVHVTLLPGFQLGGLSRDKFLIMSTPIDMTSNDYKADDLNGIWRDTSGRKLFQQRLKCTGSVDDVNACTAGTASCTGNAVLLHNGTTNGSPSIPATLAFSSDGGKQLKQMATNLNRVMECQLDMHGNMRRMQFWLALLVMLVAMMSGVMGWLVKSHWDGTTLFGAGTCSKLHEGPTQRI